MSPGQFRWTHWAVFALGLLAFLALDRLPNPTNWLVDNTWATIHALLIGAIIVIPLLVYASHDSANEWLAKILSGVSLAYPLVCAVVYATLIVGNIHFDRGTPPRGLVVRVLAKDSEADALRHRIRVESWDVSHDSESLSVDEEHVFRAIKAGESNVRLAIKPGRLGYAWLRTIRIEPPLAPPPGLKAAKTLSPVSSHR